NIDILSEGSYDNRGLNTIFEAVVEATEEAVINALLAATTMRGREGHVLHALPHDRLRELLVR
ncbi:MAG TPA: P1 family peptidase, partial [Ktedonobacterales bacterium]|nr:P1 family peptidase [Ktedonobacterales bacterium]